HRDGVPRRHPLLVPENLRPHVPGVVGTILRVLNLRGLQPNVFSTVYSGVPGHATAVSRLSAGVSSTERDVYRRGVDPRSGLCAAAVLLALGDAPWAQSAAEPVACDGPGMANALAAAEGQFPQDA